MEFASEESMNTVVTPEESMEHKRSKLSLSQRKNEAKLSLTAKLNTGPTQNLTNDIKDEVIEQNKKRKRNISEDPVMKETPKNKKAKLFGGGDIEAIGKDVVPVESLATSLFEKFSKKLECSPSSPRKQKKTVGISIPVETSTGAELFESDMVANPDDVSQIAKEMPQRKNSPKKKTGKQISEGIGKHARSPEKSVSQQDSEIESGEEEQIPMKTPTFEKKLKSRLQKKTEGESKFTEIKTPEKRVKQPASIKKSKDSNKANGTVSLSESSKKKKYTIKQERTEEDSECIIQELLGLSLPIASPQSTPSLLKKRTSLAKSTTLAVSAKKLSALEKTLSSSPKSVNFQIPETASPMKKPKESLSKKSLKSLASDGKEKATPAEEIVNVPSPRTPKTKATSNKLVKAASSEKITNVSLLEKKIKAEQPKKRAKLRVEKLISGVGSEDEFDKEDAVLKILQSIQPKAKSAQTNTKRKSINS